MKRLLSIPAMVGIAALLTACVGDAPSSEPSSDSGTRTSVSILRPAAALFEPVIIADEMGFFEDHGLQIDDQIGSGDPAQGIPLLLNNQVQFALAGPGELITAGANGVDVIGLAAVQLATEDAIENPTDGVMVPPASSITDLADLEGGKIGVQGVGIAPVILANAAMEAAGVDTSTIDFVVLPADSLMPSVESGNVDAIVPLGVGYMAAADAGYRALTKGTAEQIINSPQGVWLTSRSYAESNPEVVEAFFAALEDAYGYLNENKDEVRRIDTEHTELPQSYIDERFILDFSPLLEPASLETLATAMNEQGFIDTVPDLRSIIWSGNPGVK